MRHPPTSELHLPHEGVKHGANGLVLGLAHTNKLEGHCALSKRAIDGMFYHISVKQLPRYTMEFEGRYSARPMDTAETMGRIAHDSSCKRMTYESLKGPAQTRIPGNCDGC